MPDLGAQGLDPLIFNVGIYFRYGTHNYMMRARARLDSRGRLVIPKQLREAVGLREGDEVVISVRGSSLVITKASDPFARLERLLGDLTFDRSLRRVAEKEASREVARARKSPS